MPKIFVVSAPSGGGKTSLLKGLVAKTDKIKISISHTTRKMRPQEEDGKNYYFVNESEFTQMIEQGAFIEHAKVFDNYYGTSKRSVQDLMEQGNDIILEIDWQGAKQIKDNFPEAVLIFILPPSLKILSERLYDRKTDAKDTIEKRLRQAADDISNYVFFDYLLVNDVFEDTLSQMIELIKGIRAGDAVADYSKQQQEIKLASLLKELTT